MPRTFDDQGRRTDEVRPAVFDPADYHVIDFLDAKPAKGIPPQYLGSPEVAAYVKREREKRMKYFPVWDGSCAHCGYYSLRWVAVVQQNSTGQVIPFGQICEERVGFATRTDFDQFFSQSALMRKAAENRKRAAETFEWWVVRDPKNAEAAEFLMNYEGDNHFFNDVRRKMVQWGDLSDRQVAAVLKARDRKVEEANAPEPAGPTTPAPEGRVEVEGEVVFLKWYENEYGSSLKMIVLLEDGNKVFSTVPSAIYWIGQHPNQRVIEKGDRVRFTATFELSDRDEHFSFGKRPSKASVI